MSIVIGFLKCWCQKTNYGESIFPSQFDWEWLPHPIYNPDLTLSDFHLFGLSENFCIEQSFQAILKWRASLANRYKNSAQRFLCWRETKVYFSMGKMRFKGWKLYWRIKETFFPWKVSHYIEKFTLFTEWPLYYNYIYIYIYIYIVDGRIFKKCKGTKIHTRIIK